MKMEKKRLILRLDKMIILFDLLLLLQHLPSFVHYEDMLRVGIE